MIRLTNQIKKATMHCVDRLPLLINKQPGTGLVNSVSLGGPSRTINFDCGHLTGSADNLSSYSSSVGSNTSFDNLTESSMSQDADLAKSSCETTITVKFEGHKIEMVAEDNLAAVDLCHLLVLKLSLEKSVNWQLFLRLTNCSKSTSVNPVLNPVLERAIEDDEEVCAIVKRWRRTGFKYTLEMVRSKSSLNYGFLTSPTNYFPNQVWQLANCPPFANCDTEEAKRKKFNQLNHQLNFADSLQITINSMTKLIVDQDAAQLTNPLIAIKNQANKNCSASMVDGRHLVLKCDSSNWIKELDLAESEVFTCQQSHIDDELDVHELIVISNVDDQLIRLRFESMAILNCWLTMARIAKSGLKSLRRAARRTLRTSSLDSGSAGHLTGFTNSHANSYLEMEGKAYLDYSAKSSSRFTDQTPLINSAIKREAVDWKNRRTSSLNCSPTKSMATTAISGTGLSHPWFFANLSREQSVKLLDKYLGVDGVFLVRNSSRTSGSYVLSYVHSRRINHTMINFVDNDSLSLDCGRTRFYDLQQLVEFYQLNQGLPVRLTYFVSSN